MFLYEFGFLQGVIMDKVLVRTDYKNMYALYQWALSNNGFYCRTMYQICQKNCSMPLEER